MSCKNLSKFLFLFFVSILLLSFTSLVIAGITDVCLPLKTTHPLFPLTTTDIANQLGWVPSPNCNRCGGFYLETPFADAGTLNNDLIHITSDQGILFSQHGTSVSEGKITITRSGQQIVANKAYLYRDPVTDELTVIDLMDHVIFRQPNDLIIADAAHYNVKTSQKSLCHVLYRTAIYSDPAMRPIHFTLADLLREREISQLSAWGQASSVKQDQKDIYDFDCATYSTCQPINGAWKLKAGHIVLNKITGRGYATNVRLLVRNIPVFYTPYINFPIDHRRQTGFLWPAFGAFGRYGPFLKTPFYWNLAPNYDTTITPAYLSKRGFQISDGFRYLFGSPASAGNIHVAVIPHDRMFATFKETMRNTYQNSTDPVIQAELRRLLNASNARGSAAWQDNTIYNDHWSSDIDYSYVSDDYYIRDFSGNNINEATRNQLLQQVELVYKNINWNFVGRVQGYQTLHPVDESLVQNSYTRLPQLILNGDFPESYFGLNYFVNSELTHFTIQNTPGTDQKQPMGNRLNVQPGISKTYSLPYFFLTPRLQVAMTKYNLGDVNNGYPKNPSRLLPIFDVNSGLFFDRDLCIFGYPYRQTLEPQLYYVYIPYRNQTDIPLFDTTERMMNYDQLFVYNRFTGIDRIGDANQVSVGITTRLIDQQTGFEKVRAGLGQIIYFQNRRVTLCEGANCANNPLIIANRNRRSPLTGFVLYNFDPTLTGTANSIFNQKTLQLDNQSFGLHYRPFPEKQTFVNLGYNFVRHGDYFPGTNPDSGSNNLSQTDFSFAWQIHRDWSLVGRWTQNLSHRYFQNLLYGLQYDSCCWAIRAVAGRTFVNLAPNNIPVYNNGFYIQFALKGLGDISGADGDPSQMLSSNIAGYQSNFGRDF